MPKRKIIRTLRNMSPKQLGILLVLFLVFVGLCFVLEKTGVTDKLLTDTGVQDNTPPPAMGTLEAHILNVGNADSIFLTCNGKTMLIDAGEKNDGEAVVNYLQEHGVEKLDYVLASHAHADHIGGMRTVLEEIPVGKFLISYMPEGREPTTALYLNMLATLDEKNIPVKNVKVGDTFSLGDATVAILSPAGEFEGMNDHSVVCRVTHGDKRLLFTADAEREAEKAMLSAGLDLKADLIKLGHHGSDTSSTTAFLKAVEAKIAVISCGENDYGHPHKEVLERVKKRGMTLYRTDQKGTVKVISDGKNLKIETEKG